MATPPVSTEELKHETAAPEIVFPGAGTTGFADTEMTESPRETNVNTFEERPMRFESTSRLDSDTNVQPEEPQVGGTTTSSPGLISRAVEATKHAIESAVEVVTGGKEATKQAVYGAVAGAQEGYEEGKVEGKENYASVAGSLAGAKEGTKEGASGLTGALSAGLETTKKELQGTQERAGEKYDKTKENVQEEIKQDDSYGTPDIIGRTKEVAAGAYDYVATKACETRDAVAGAVSSATQMASDTAEAAKEKTAETAEWGKQKTAEVADVAAQKTADAAEWTKEKTHETADAAKAKTDQLAESAKENADIAADKTKSTADTYADKAKSNTDTSSSWSTKPTHDFSPHAKVGSHRHEAPTMLSGAYEEKIQPSVSENVEHNMPASANTYGIKEQKITIPEHPTQSELSPSAERAKLWASEAKTFQTSPTRR